MEHDGFRNEREEKRKKVLGLAIASEETVNRIRLSKSAQRIVVGKFVGKFTVYDGTWYRAAPEVSASQKWPCMQVTRQQESANAPVSGRSSRAGRNEFECEKKMCPGRRRSLPAPPTGTTPGDRVNPPLQSLGCPSCSQATRLPLKSRAAELTRSSSPSRSP
ncbi:uncharacterized protein LOC119766173 [Culex quinquefasciatus]|uniref:uncharacterized protein LOC119766173 n=1 Tax=Culex quinquefasciatus TaxID=7176 RepID=UPI0018E31D46|nr:uncharacterized protein LOC119766173 [Culex quinquefasciatus]